MIKKRLNLRNVAKIAVACLAVVVMLMSCKKEDTGSLGGSQSPIGNEGTRFNVSGISGIVTSPSARVTALDNGVSTISLSGNITNSTYLGMVATLYNVVVTGTTAVQTLNWRITSEGIQEIFPEGNLTLVKYNAKEGDVYKLKRGAHTLRREVTVVSNKDEYSWNGMNIKTIHVKETGMGVPGVDYVEYVTNHRFGLVGIKIFFENGTSISAPIVGSVTN